MRRQAAVFVSVPAEPLVGDFRLRHQPRAVTRGLPPHITVLPPFTLDSTADETMASHLRTHFAAVPGFAGELVRVDAFARHVWLAPEPHDRFVALLSETRLRFPDLAGGDDREPVPHLTIAEIGKGESTRRVVQLAEEEIAPRLPFSFELRDVGLFEARSDGWHELQRFELG